MDTAQLAFSIFFPIALLAAARTYRAWREMREAREAETELSPLADAFCRGEAPWQSAQPSPLAQAFCRGEAPWQIE